MAHGWEEAFSHLLKKFDAAGPLMIIFKKRKRLGNICGTRKEIPVVQSTEHCFCKTLYLFHCGLWKFH